MAINRLIFDAQIGHHRVQFHVVPFFFSRQFTILVWCVRILPHFKNHSNNSGCIMLLGNVEFDYQTWKQNHAHERSAKKWVVKATVEKIAQRIAGNSRRNLMVAISKTNPSDS
uniref:Uncharacterized protein n=1 Tax=Globisporangium ultimum (strain ATCC 200006 / CBS 805.95 / DAOM BR144) TaxID=431595 RepID=K3WJ57_GLOUD